MKEFIAAALAAGLALTSVGAHETVIERKEDGKHKVVKIVRHGDHDGDHAGHKMHLRDCDADSKAADVTEETSKGGKVEKQRVVICAKPGHQTSAEAAAHLAKARDRIAKDDNLSAEIKAKVLASLDAAIARHSKP